MELVKKERKTKKAAENAEEIMKKAQATIDEANASAEAAQKELEREIEAEKQMLENAEKSINDIAAANDLFCGVILTADDIAAVLTIALKTHENIKIPFRLYFNE